MNYVRKRSYCCSNWIMTKVPFWPQSTHIHPCDTSNHRKSAQFSSLYTFRHVVRTMPEKNRRKIVTASSGTAISTDFATLICSEILSKILIRCVTWHWACDCSFRCFYEIGRYFDNKEQERAKTRARRHDRSQRRQEHPKIDSFWGANPGFYRFSALCYPM